MQSNPFDRNLSKIILPIITILIVIVLLSGSFFTVSAGTSAIKLRFGKVVASYEEGFHFKIPFVDKIEKFSIRIKKNVIATEAFSRDLQTVKVGIAVNHRIQANTVIAIYRNLGADYVATVLTPMVEEWIKAVVARYSAESLIANRIVVAKELDDIIKEKMSEKQVIVSDIAIVDFDFSPQFLKAVEEKQIAEQEAKRATNLVEKVKKEAEQQILKAEAEAKALRLQREVVSDQLIKLRQTENQQKAIEKWDGKMPQYLAGGDLPFVMVK
ncbi:MAG: prohibitin family protein [Elusimicrobiota bacterium]|jgi:regulator of protease activity HflC (stomatin/prohibitin superfamily)|nr:prohibitin family protein [Elusimicrobiota bacterium]